MSATISHDFYIRSVIGRSNSKIYITCYHYLTIRQPTSLDILFSNNNLPLQPPPTTTTSYHNHFPPQPLPTKATLLHGQAFTPTSLFLHNQFGHHATLPAPHGYADNQPCKGSISARPNQSPRHSNICSHSELRPAQHASLARLCRLPVSK